MTLTVQDWRQSPAATAKPSHDIVLADNDMNSWLYVRAGEIQPPQGSGRWTVLRARLTPHRGTRERGGTIVFKDLVGRGEIWIDGKHASTKPDFAAATLRVAFPPGPGERIVTLLLESDGTVASGLGGLVFVED
jgi:beta-galactosidase